MIYITGDLHGEIDIYNKDYSKLKKDDYLIILGDFGVLFSNTCDKNEKKVIDFLDNSKPFTTLFIDGNHENFDRINKLPKTKMFNDNVGVVSTSIFHLKRGRVYTIEEKTFFTFGGGESIDKNRRIEGVSWWPEEMPNYQEMALGLTSLSKVGNKADYILTHAAPSKICYEMDFDNKLMIKFKPNGLNKYLDEIDNLVDFKHWYFGHYHYDQTFRDKYTLLYNSVIKII